LSKKGEILFEIYNVKSIVRVSLGISDGKVEPFVVSFCVCIILHE